MIIRKLKKEVFKPFYSIHDVWLQIQENTQSGQDDCSQTCWHAPTSPREQPGIAVPPGAGALHRTQPLCWWSLPEGVSLLWGCLRCRCPSSHRTSPQQNSGAQRRVCLSSHLCWKDQDSYWDWGEVPAPRFCLRGWRYVGEIRRSSTQHSTGIFVHYESCLLISTQKSYFY